MRKAKRTVKKALLTEQNYRNILRELVERGVIQQFEFSKRKTRGGRAGHVTLVVMTHDQRVTIYLHFDEDTGDVSSNNDSSRRIDIWISNDIRLDELREIIEAEIIKRYNGFSNESFTAKLLIEMRTEGIINNVVNVTKEEDIQGTDLIIDYKGIKIPVDITTDMTTKVGIRTENQLLYPGLLRHEVPILLISPKKRKKRNQEKVVSVCEEFLLRHDAEVFLENMRHENNRIDEIGMDAYLLELSQGKTVSKKVGRTRFSKSERRIKLGILPVKKTPKRKIKLLGNIHHKAPDN